MDALIISVVIFSISYFAENALIKLILKKQKKIKKHFNAPLTYDSFWSRQDIISNFFVNFWNSFARWHKTFDRNFLERHFTT